MSSMTVRTEAGFNEKLVAELVNLHHQSFPPHMKCADPTGYFTEALGEASNLNIVMRGRDGTVIGYLRAFPHNDVVEELRPWDPDLEEDPDRLYLDIIMILPGQRGKGHAFRLFQAVCGEAEKRGFFKLSMHARTSNDLNTFLHRIFAEIRFLRRIDNWYGSGEPFDYLEATTTLKPRHAGCREARTVGKMH